MVVLYFMEPSPEIDNIDSGFRLSLTRNTMYQLSLPRLIHNFIFSKKQVIFKVCTLIFAQYALNTHVIVFTCTILNLLTCQEIYIL